MSAKNNKKISKTKLNKMKKEIIEMNDSLEKYYSQKYELESDIVNIKQTLNEKNQSILEYSKGTVEMDIKKYLQIKAEVVGLEKDLATKSEGLLDLENNYSEIEKVVGDSIYNSNYADVKEEYNSNRLYIISEMFTHMMEVVKLSEELSNIAKETEKGIVSIGTTRAYKTIVPEGLGQFISRFVLSVSSIEYSQGWTTELYDFEEDYFKNK